MFTTAIGYKEGRYILILNNTYDNTRSVTFLNVFFFFQNLKASHIKMVLHANCIARITH